MVNFIGTYRSHRYSDGTAPRSHAFNATIASNNAWSSPFVRHPLTAIFTAPRATRAMETANVPWRRAWTTGRGDGMNDPDCLFQNVSHKLFWTGGSAIGRGQVSCDPATTRWALQTKA